jgi:hypothetical protein
MQSWHLLGPKMKFQSGTRQNLPRRVLTSCELAIANAVDHATGRRIRSLPITVEQLL